MRRRLKQLQCAKFCDRQIAPQGFQHSPVSHGLLQRYQVVVVVVDEAEGEGLAACMARYLVEPVPWDFALNILVLKKKMKSFLLFF
jgi:hypothetical protein